VIQELQGQITLATGCPGILLYGRRRTGKTTLLRNLPPFLPDSIAVVPLSMQDPRMFTSPESFAGRVVAALDGRDAAGDALDLGAFFDRLTRLDTTLATDDRRLLIALDEYEHIDTKLGEGVFTTALLDTLRESIQRHRRLVWLFAGSHELAELSHAEWPSYFVSLRTIEIGLFTSAETILLLTEPLQRSELFAKDEARRPRFAPTFWGEGGIARIHAEAAGCGRTSSSSSSRPWSSWSISGACARRARPCSTRRSPRP
jgi:hypothetical protein